MTESASHFPLSDVKGFWRKIRKAVEPDSNTVNFNILDTVHTSPSITDAMEQSMKTIWINHVHKKTRMNIHLLPGLSGNRIACYQPHLDLFQFDIEKILTTGSYGESHGASCLIVNGRFIDEMSPEEVITFLAAHETMHKVQIYRGEKPISSSLLSPLEYHNDIFENEARIVGAHALKFLYPQKQGIILLSEPGKICEIPIPNRSYYD